MSVFLATLSRMAFLFALILAGWLLARRGSVPDDAPQVLSRLENALFIPALMMGTFMDHFTPARLRAAGGVFLAGFAFCAAGLPVAVLLARLCARDTYRRRIYTYGLAFSNFGFMGNAVVSALFPDLFAEYLIFTLPYWVFIDVWGIPALLIADNAETQRPADALKRLCNPMMAGMLLGMVWGLSGLGAPAWIADLVSATGACMSPVAMLLTGMTVARMSPRRALSDRGIWTATGLRLILLPAVTIAILMALRLPEPVELCALCVSAMPLGLNTIVIPGAYGRDTSTAAGMALISHAVSCLTIPLAMMAINWI